MDIYDKHEHFYFSDNLNFRDVDSFKYAKHVNCH